MKISSLNILKEKKKNGTIKERKKFNRILVGKENKQQKQHNQKNEKLEKIKKNFKTIPKFETEIFESDNNSFQKQILNIDQYTKFYEKDYIKNLYERERVIYLLIIIC